MHEKEYTSLKEELNSIPMPKEALTNARKMGLKKIHNERQNRKRWSTMLAASVALILIFLTTIRVSPAFAQAVAKIPGFAPLVEMIAFDKGIEDVLKNNYYEELNITETKNHLTFSLLGIIADESGMMINYKLEAPFDIHELETNKVEIKQDHKGLEAAISYSWFENEPTNHIEEVINVSSSKNIDYTNPNFEFTITFKDEHETTFNIPFSLQKEIAKSKVYQLNQSVEIDDQKFTVKLLRISPLRARLDISVEPENTMQILQIRNMRLLDEKGEEWGTITNGITGFGGMRESEASFFFQSNYFREPKKLTLEISDVQALPKGEDYIEVDFLKKEVLYVPDSADVHIDILGNSTVQAKQQIKKQNHIYQMFSKAIDAKGETVETAGMTHHTSDETTDSTYSFKTNNKTNPVRIYFHSYENYLKGSATVEIPLK